jgi:signal transduction histidine kinase
LPILKRSVEDFHSASEQKEIELIEEYPKQTIWINGDTTWLIRALHNLLHNAQQHTPKGGRIKLGVHIKKHVAFIRIHNTGKGLDPKEIPKLFTPLYRGEKSRNRKTGGAGLGLTIAKRVFVSHGGDLRAYNDEEGGAVFTGVLPILKEKEHH